MSKFPHHANEWTFDPFHPSTNLTGTISHTRRIFLGIGFRASNPQLTEPKFGHKDLLIFSFDQMARRIAESALHSPTFTPHQREKS
ncbi:hypothetical protein AVEN_249912-1 [Araneus ventricosus]|uniref:Uncharacterized protein n=1 Tax=Araneus ventricosus TaxID=182803 RepID=A0A4Y2DX75_ARAVE|nr:hypothetical protein AVEN_249912-1 [Araneus ventricosus]